MAFYNKTLLVLAAIGIASLYANMTPAKMVFFSVTITLIVILAIWVSIYSWKKPRNLLYGADTHLEQLRLEYVSGFGSAQGATPERAAGD